MNTIETSKLRSGDIVFTRDKSSSTSWIIRVGTIAEYSHALLCVDDHSFIDSDMEGVHSNNFQRLIFDQPGDVSAKRLKNLPLGSDIKNICDYARLHVGQQYSKMEAVRSALGNSRHKASDRLFCSRLVARAYAHAGIALVDNIDFCTPKDLYDSELLIEIHNICRPASVAEVSFAQDESRNALKRQEAITNSFLASVRKISDTSVSTMSEVFNLAGLDHILDPLIANLLLESGYLTMWQWDMASNPHWYDASAYRESVPAHLHSSEAKRMLPSALNALQRHIDNLANINQRNKQHPSQTGELFAILERKLCEITNQRIAVLRVYSR